MSDHSNSSSSATSQGQPPRKRRTWLLVTSTAVAAALTGAIATTALSEQGPPWRHGHMDGFMGGGMMGGGMMHGRFHRGPIDPARAENRADRMVRHLAIEIDANAEQQDKLRTIARDAIRDLLPLREKAQTARERARALLTQPTVDRAAIEAFRAEQLSLADEASRRIAKALGDAAETLTPEQRRQIDDHLQSRRGPWRPWHRG